MLSIRKIPDRFGIRYSLLGLARNSGGEQIPAARKIRVRPAFINYPTAHVCRTQVLPPVPYPRVAPDGEKDMVKKWVYS